jgi:polysaccharide export outer membrane protein
MKKNIKNQWLVISVCFAVFALSACSPTPSRGVVVVKSSTQQNQAKVTESAPEAIMSPAAEVIDDKKYEVAVGDILEIFVWRNPELSVTVPVRPDGYISIPLVDDLEVVGVTTTAISRQIEALLQSYIKFPKVTVMVTSFGADFAQQVRVIGQAAEPRSLPYRKDMTLLDMLIAVGGLTEFAAGNRAVLIREVDGKKTKIGLRLEDLIGKGDLSQNMTLKAGDIVIIPESYF